MLSSEDLAVLPVDQWISQGVEWLGIHLRPMFQAIRWPVEHLLGLSEDRKSVV